MDASCPAVLPAFDISTAPVVVVEVGALAAGYSPRASDLDADHALLLSGVEQPLPPIIVHRDGMRVIDGMHRVRAAILRGDTTIRAQLFDGSDDAAFLLAVRSNVAHGLPLTLAERKVAALRILTTHPEWSDRSVAAATGLSDKTVASVRRVTTVEFPRSAGRRGADGRVRPLDSGRRRRQAADLIHAQPQRPLREIARAAGISLSTVRDVRARLDRGEDPVPGRRRPCAQGQVDALPGTESGPGMHDAQQRLATLERLCNDPSLRFSESGRNAVRWLYTRLAGLDHWDDLVEAIPPHWAEVVADLARGCAGSWQEFAAACDRRARRAS